MEAEYATQYSAGAAPSVRSRQQFNIDQCNRTASSAAKRLAGIGQSARNLLRSRSSSADTASRRLMARMPAYNIGSADMLRFIGSGHIYELLLSCDELIGQRAADEVFSGFHEPLMHAGEQGIRS